MEYLHLIRDEDDRTMVQRVAQNDPTLTQYNFNVYGKRVAGNADFLLAMGHALRGNTHIRWIELGGRLVLNEEVARAFAQGMAQSKLESIHLTGNLIIEPSQDDESLSQRTCDTLFSRRICDIIYRGIQASNTIRRMGLWQSVADDPGDAWKDALLGLREIILGHCGDGYAGAFSEVLSRATLLTDLMVAFPIAESADVIAMLAHGICQNTSITRLTLTNHFPEYANLSKRDMRLLLTQRLNPNSAITKLKIEGCNMGGGCIELLVERWLPTLHIEELALLRSTIDPSGAQRLMQAVAGHSTLVKLDLSDNTSIGYKGLRMIGEELPNLHHLTHLDLYYCSIWTYFLEDESEEAAQAQMKARQQAGQALLEGIKHNFSITDLKVRQNQLPRNVKHEIDFYCALNKGRYLLAAEDDPGLAPSVWCQVLTQCQRQNHGASLVFFYLKELPTLVQSRRY